MEEHSPAPWKVLPNDETAVQAANGEVVARAFRVFGGGSGQGNARLMAAAPELLEYLELVLMDYRELRMIHLGGKHEDTPRMKLAEAAIAKAEGKGA